MARIFAGLSFLLVLAQTADARPLNNQFQPSNAARTSSGESSTSYSKGPPRAYSGTNPQPAARSLNQLRGMGTLNGQIRNSGTK
jgi:hypothetical protein